VTADDDYLTVRLEDGRRIAVPTAWFPRLARATDEQRSNWRLIGRGVGIHWPDIDEDISVENLLRTEHPILALGPGGFALLSRDNLPRPAAEEEASLEARVRILSNQGYSNSDIARILSMSERTVRRRLAASSVKRNPTPPPSTS
jgi:hypothetical protein